VENESKGPYLDHPARGRAINGNKPTLNELSIPSMDKKGWLRD